MSFEKGMKRPLNSGRRAGTPNKNTVRVREMFEDVFTRMGGADAFVAWVMESNDNKREFYKMFAKLLPTDIYTSSGAINIIVSENVDNI